MVLVSIVSLCLLVVIHYNTCRKIHACFPPESRNIFSSYFIEFFNALQYCRTLYYNNIETDGENSISKCIQFTLFPKIFLIFLFLETQFQMFKKFENITSQTPLLLFADSLETHCAVAYTFGDVNIQMHRHSGIELAKYFVYIVE